MLVQSILLAHFALAQGGVIVRDKESKAPVDQATVHIWMGSKEAEKKTTGADGKALFDQDYRGAVIQAEAKGYDGGDANWPMDGDPNALIRVQVTRVRPRRCTVTVMRMVQEVREYNFQRTTISRPVYDTIEVDCPDFQLPQNPAPPGYHYQLDHVDRRYSDDMRSIIHRPHYRLVPDTGYQLQMVPADQSMPGCCQ